MGSNPAYVGSNSTYVQYDIIERARWRIVNMAGHDSVFLDTIVRCKEKSSNINGKKPVGFDETVGN